MVRFLQFATESESGRRGSPRARDGNEGLIGDAGAYISESWDSCGGEVSAVKSCRTLSHWLCVVVNEVCNATLRLRRGDCALVGL